jgi:hypothetical protein
MKKNIIGISFLVITLMLLVSFGRQKSNIFSVYSNPSEILAMPLSNVLIDLGDNKPNHCIKNIDLDSAQMAKEMVVYGKLKDNSNKRISKFFVCTDYHNHEKETKNLWDGSADERIKYGIDNNLPFLPASTFYGMYNKEHWYNGDYKEKYVELVIPSRDNLKNAIQLCAVQCSQVRSLENWEIRSILHYYKSLEIKIENLNLNTKELKLLANALELKNKKAVEVLKQKYSVINDATFGDKHIKLPDNYEPNLENGKYIY